MPRWSLIALLLLGVVCAGIGSSLSAAFAPLGAAGFGWTAYSPLTRTVYSGSYAPIDTTWLIWAPRLGFALLTLGAGTTGAATAALFIGRRRRATVTREHQAG